MCCAFSSADRRPRTDIAVSCDMGEGLGLWRLAEGEAPVPHIDLADVACGFHAGEAVVMRETGTAAREHGVRLGGTPALRTYRASAAGPWR